MGWLSLVVMLTVFWFNVFGVSCFGSETSLSSGAVEGGYYPPHLEVEAHELLSEAYREKSQRDGVAQEDGRQLTVAQAEEEDAPPESSEDWMEAEDVSLVPDPLEPLNRVFFQFNDKLYFWVLKPLATGYAAVFPELARVSIRNFFLNLYTPIRAANCLLQGKFEGVGIELVRFAVNTSAGFLGFQDVARVALNMERQDEDLGQTFAFYGIGPGFYIHWPILGASNLRDTVGWVGDQVFNPLDIFGEGWYFNIALRSYDFVNSTSLRIGEYEDLKRASLDPYVAMRDAYEQYRRSQIEK